MLWRAFLFLPILWALLAPVSLVRAEGPTLDDIARELVCQCGCQMVLNNCNHAECGSREAMNVAISQQLKQGRSKDEIIASFVAQYGEKVLAAPTKQGFNLVAWVLPFVAVATGGLVVYFILTAWVLKGREPLPTEAVVESEEDRAYRERLKRELKDFS